MDSASAPGLPHRGRLCEFTQLSHPDLSRRHMFVIGELDPKRPTLFPSRLYREGQTEPRDDQTDEDSVPAGPWWLGAMLFTVLVQSVTLDAIF